MKTIRLRSTFASFFFDSARGGRQNWSQLTTNAVREFFRTGEEIDKSPPELRAPELGSAADINQFNVHKYLVVVPGHFPCGYRADSEILSNCARVKLFVLVALHR